MNSQIKKMTEKEYQKEITGFKNAKYLHCFLMNVFQFDFTQ